MFQMLDASNNNHMPHNQYSLLKIDERNPLLT